MRWFLLILAALVAASALTALLHPPAPVVGQSLAYALEADEPLRGAMLVIDYKPDPAQLAALESLPLATGDGDPPGEQLTSQPRPNSRWARTSTQAKVPVASDITSAQFAWQTHPTEPLRQFIKPDAQPRLARALASLPAMQYQVEHLLDQAAIELNRCTDAELLDRWLKADRGVLIARQDPVAAAEDALLLLARDNAGPVLQFQVPAAGETTAAITALPLPSKSPTILVDLSAYNPAGQILFHGTLDLQTRRDADPAEVRLWCYRMADLASKETPRRDR